MDLNPIELLVFPQDVLREALCALARLDSASLPNVEVARRLSDLGMPFLGEAVARNKNPIPLRSVFKIAVKRHEATCMLVETPYLDMEFWDSYAHVYSRSFKQFRKYCERLHFFRGPVGEEGGLREMIEGGASAAEVAEAGFSYLGFAVMRPTASYNVGRVALRFDSRPGKELPNPPASDDPEYEGRPRSKGSCCQAANLLCAGLSVPAVPFVQQDVVTGMCATASCWTASQVLGERHDLHKFPYLEITRHALSGLGGPEADAVVTERGLNLDGIRKALARTGAHPVEIVPAEKAYISPFSPNISFALRAALYTFVESHVPVIVLLDDRSSRRLHAVCAVGHLQRHIVSYSQVRRATDVRLHADLPANHYLVGETVLQYYVNDDAYGPYNRLRFLSPAEHQALNTKIEKHNKRQGHDANGGKFRCPVELVGRDYGPLELKALIAPVPPYVRNRPEVVTESAIRKLVKSRTVQRISEMTGHPCNVLWRVILTKGSTFKQSLHGRGYGPALRAAYARVHLPKYVWVCEFSLFEERDTAAMLGANDSRKIHGEFIYDTSTPSFDVNRISYRVGRRFYHRNDSVTAIPLSEPYEQDCFVEG